MRATIKTVAALCGYSKSTVARVINNEPGVRPEVREIVLEAARKANYRPNSIGKALQNQSKKSIRIGVIMNHNEYTLRVRAGMDAAAQELADFGLELIYFDSGVQSCEDQLSVLETAMQSDLSGIILKALENPLINEKVNSLVESGIPVMTVTTDLPDSKRLCFVGQDTRRAGCVAGNLMGKMLPAGSTVVVFKEIEPSTGFEQRFSGFMEELKTGSPDIRVVDCVSIEEGSAENYQISYNYFRSHPQVNGVLVTGSSHGDIARALMELGLSAQVKMICYDVLQNTGVQMALGAIDFVITQSPFEQGRSSVKNMFNLLFNGTRPPAEFNYVPIRIKDKFTANNF